MNDVEHSIESVRTAVVRVRDVEIALRLRIEISEKGQLCRPASPFSKLLQAPKVVPVHSQDQIECREIFGSHRSGAALDLDPISIRRCD